MKKIVFLFVMLGFITTSAYAEYIPTPTCANGQWQLSATRYWTITNSMPCQNDGDIQPYTVQASYTHPAGTFYLTMIATFFDKNGQAAVIERSHAYFPWGGQWNGGRHSEAAKCGPTSLLSCPVLTNG
jgi:hypothetical protein